MQKTTGRKQTRSYQAAVVFVLALGAALAAVVAPTARAGQQQQAGYGKTTGLVGIVQGQTARLAVWNKGDEAVLTRLQFVNEQGKVEFLCDVVIPPGKAEMENFSITDGTSRRVELQAQFGTNEKRSIGLLMPTLQIIDDKSGATVGIIGPEHFAEFRPVWMPALVAPW
jgi:hypothetical protein